MDTKHHPVPNPHGNKGRHVEVGAASPAQKVSIDTWRARVILTVVVIGSVHQVLRKHESNWS